MNELFDKQVSAQKNTPRVHASFCKPTKNCVMKMKVVEANEAIVLMEEITL